MEIYRTEEEQLEVLKSWLQRNGRAVALGVGIALVLVFGYQLWKNNRQNYNQSASVAYQEIIEAAQRADTLKASALEATTLNTLGKKLIQDYPRSVYAQLTAVLLAKQALHDNQLKKATDQLQWALDHHPDENLRLLVQLRLARVFLASHRFAEAQALLNVDKDNSYFPLYQEVTGDLFAAQGKTAQAKQAYQASLNALAKEKDKAPWIQTKLDNL